jgi:hypothetical protein
VTAQLQLMNIIIIINDVPKYLVLKSSNDFNVALFRAYPQLLKCTVVQALRLCTGRTVQCTVVQALRFCTSRTVKCTPVQALRLCTSHTAHRRNRGIALPFHDHGTRRGESSASRPGRSLPRERPGTHYKGGWVDPRTVLDRRGKCRPHRDSITRPSSP